MSGFSPLVLQQRLARKHRRGVEVLAQFVLGQKSNWAACRCVAEQLAGEVSKSREQQWFGRVSLKQEPLGGGKTAAVAFSNCLVLSS